MTESTEIATNFTQVLHEKKAVGCWLLCSQLWRTRGVMEMLIATLIQNTYELSKGVVQYGPPIKRIFLFFSNGICQVLK